jgi:hypothetical protein
MAAAFDYAPLQETAQALIDRFGRAATLTRAARLSTEDPAKPWLPVQGQDPAAAPAQSIDVTAAFLSLVRTDRAGQVVEAKTQSVLIGAESELPEEVGPDWTLVDVLPATAHAGAIAKTWEVLSSKPLRPGGTLLLYRLELAL